MIIQKILEKLIHPERSEQKYRGQLRTNPDFDDEFHRTAKAFGRYSVVHPDKTDPHMIKKHNARVMGTNEESDAYEYFVDYILAEDLADKNIHFPRIYKVKKIQDKNGKYIKKYQIEKLEPLLSLEEDEIKSIIESHFNMDPDKLFGYSKREFCYEMADRIRNCIFNKDEDYLLEDSLKEACSLIRKLVNDISNSGLSIRVDIHFNNIMARRTPHGLQLVITDPVV